MRIMISTMLGFAVTQGAWAQISSSPAPRTAMSQDASAIPAGIYKLDPRHTSIVARIGHGGGLSFSTFRFGIASGTLDWSQNATASKLTVNVDMSSIETPVPGFAQELAGDHFLKTGQYRDAVFVSNSIEPTGPRTARVRGDLTFMGQTRPATIDALLVGTGILRNIQIAGFSGTLRFKRSDFGFSTLMGPISNDVEIQLDAEFDKIT